MSSESKTFTDAVPQPRQGFDGQYFLVLHVDPKTGRKSVEAQGKIIGIYEGLHVAHFVGPTTDFTQVIPVQQIHRFTFFQTEEHMAAFVKAWAGGYTGPTEPGHEPNEDPRRVNAVVNANGDLEVTIEEGEEKAGC